MIPERHTCHIPAARTRAPALRPLASRRARSLALAHSMCCCLCTARAAVHTDASYVNGRSWRTTSAAWTSAWSQRSATEMQSKLSGAWAAVAAGATRACVQPPTGARVFVGAVGVSDIAASSAKNCTGRQGTGTSARDEMLMRCPALALSHAACLARCVCCAYHLPPAALMCASPSFIGAVCPSRLSLALSLTVSALALLPAHVCHALHGEPAPARAVPRRHSGQTV